MQRAEKFSIAVDKIEEKCGRNVKNDILQKRTSVSQKRLIEISELPCKTITENLYSKSKKSGKSTDNLGAQNDFTQTFNDSLNKMKILYLPSSKLEDYKSQITSTSNAIILIQAKNANLEHTLSKVSQLKATLDGIITIGTNEIYLVNAEIIVVAHIGEESDFLELLKCNYSTPDAFEADTQRIASEYDLNQIEHVDKLTT